MKAGFALSLIALVACDPSDTPLESQHVHTGGVGYDAPKGWAKTGTHTHTSETTTWAPAGDNPAKESISVVWSKVAPFPNANDVDKLLAQGESGLREPRIGKPYQIASGSGLPGFQIETDYKPVKDSPSYHRVHAVLIDGDALVNVFYVATDPDETRAALRLVLNSIRNEEG